ncbi:nuclear transport factor 2 family protein [soil metagenome]
MLKKTILFAFLVVGSLLTVDGFAQSNEQAVSQAVDKLRTLMIDPTKGGLEALAADALTYGHSNGKLEDKKAFVDALVSGESDFKTIDLTEQTITVIDNTAIVRHKLSAVTANSGTPGTAKLAVLLVWIKQNKDWKLLARQAVKI